MRILRFRTIAVVCVVAFTNGCAYLSRGVKPGAEDDSRVVFENGGITLKGAALTDGAGSLLETMAGKVPNFRVIRSAAPGRCPILTLRNDAGSQTVAPNPLIYVDGTRTMDTCVLESLRRHDVERVEIYPQGFTTRPGYGTHQHGLILVFMKSL